jgi:hypothetical protein
MVQSVPRLFKKGVSMEDLWVIALLGWIVASWFTHVVVCLTAGKWGFLIAGAIIFPIAWIHGTGIWLGFF